MADSFYYAVEDGDVPPSYYESISPPSFLQSLSPSHSTSLTTHDHVPRQPHPGTTLLPSSLTTSLTSPFTTHLQNLPIHMRATQEARSTEQASRDLEIITLLAPHVERFLSDLGSAARIPPVAEITLVPGDAVPRGAAMSGAAERRREGEVVRVIRVQAPAATKQDSDSKGVNGSTSEKGGASRGSFIDDNDNEDLFNDDDDDDGLSHRRSESEFDEWGRFDTDKDSASSAQKGWFFRDEGMAHRLATYLRPEPNLDRRHIQAVVAGRVPASPNGSGGSPAGQSSQSSSGWRWGRKKAVPQQQQQSVAVGASPLLGPGETETASMAVRAEEITFRVENEMGIYESLRGWGIVVTVKIRS